MGSIKALSKPKKKEKKQEKKEEKPPEKLEAKVEEQVPEEIVRPEVTPPDLEDTVDAIAEAENLPPPQPETQETTYQPVTQQPQTPEYIIRPGEEKIEDVYQPRSQEIQYQKQEQAYQPGTGQAAPGGEAEETLSRKIAKKYLK